LSFKYPESDQRLLPVMNRVCLASRN